MTILNIFVGFLYPSDAITLYDRDSQIDTITENLGGISGFITGGLLEIGAFLFSLYGIDFIGFITDLPSFIATLFVVFNLSVVLATVFYIIDRFWIG